MRRAYVLMTAMPPTKGHLALIEFAERLVIECGTVEVLVVTQPSEPYAHQRVAALQRATKQLRVNVHHLHRELPQEPDTGGFFEMWAEFMTLYGLQPDDYIVASEKYGYDLARVTGATFIPFDIARDLDSTRATAVRERPRLMFDHVLPEFQYMLRKTVTLFGAESTGKTTLSRWLAENVNGHWTPEWARPYLEQQDHNLATEEDMFAIWKGQAALEDYAFTYLKDKPFLIRDTDLFTTVGYWDYALGNTPGGLIDNAYQNEADLYLILTSTIPFEPDPLRVGGDHRETSDEYWINLAETHGLNYKVIDSSFNWVRTNHATQAMIDLFDNNHGLTYERRGQ